MRSKFYNRNPFNMLRSFFTVVLLLLGSHTFAQTITYSQAFTHGVAPTSGQCNAWATFCSSLVPGYQYTGFQLTSSASGTVYTCTDAAVATAIAAAMRTGANTTQTSDGHTWYVGTGCGAGCGTVSVELSADQGKCSCGIDVSIRPQINNANWGGIGGTCNAPSQTLTVIFTYRPLVFTGGSTLSVCRNAAATSINSLLTTNDTTNSSTVTWNVASAPAHGTLSGFPASATSGTGISPAGLNYTPATGYVGNDTFSIGIADGYGNTDTTTIYVTVVAPSAVFTPPGPVCLGSPVTFVSSAPLCSGEALNFNGTTSGATGALPTTAVANVTLEAWVKWDGGGSGNQMIALNGNSSTSGYGIFQNGGVVNVIAGGVSTMTSSYTLTPGVWTHIAAVADGSDNWTLYVNGVPNVLSPSTGNPNTPAGTFSVGTDQAGIETFSGVI